MIPVECEYFALEGISSLMETMDAVKETLNPDLAIEGVLLTMYDDRTTLARSKAAVDGRTVDLDVDGRRIAGVGTWRDLPEIGTDSG